jgi:ABC-type nitrate/sulfonate/bicarbonate transport system permease component
MAQVQATTRRRVWLRRPGSGAIGPVDRGKLARWAMSIALFFLLWEAIGRSRQLIAILPASEVLPDLASQIAEGDILVATLGTLRIAAVGFLIGTAIGVPVGLLLGLSERWSSVLDPLVNASLSAPIAMFIPVIAVYFGLEFKAKVIGVLLFNVFVIIVNTATGIREVPPSVVEMGRAFGTSRTNMYRRIILPWASPYIITGLRIGVGRSVEGAILFDLFLRTENLGLVIRNAAGSFDLSTLLGSVFFITIIAAVTMGLARIVEWRLLRWKTG